ncbi:cysteine protease ATG4B isoform X2 [Physcomitrium patens]|uniref:Cysteine protease n=1 Tax=Physcomitrium patens TaxID=3218 RepID=A0A2K1K9Q4_PHYPA|nr:cysteine protease ATG4B-like isoform X2 [Physcomitrium patens]PNR50507.1 hypothetical protein PHYPA_009693 [Physcomitrium patens]|eukprot:XP_024380625.1 cysteine protease ATG4B-like isoform X2 [Physcomitrella patens]
MQRLQELLLRHRFTAADSSSGGEIWVLGICYKVSADANDEAVSAHAFEEFLNDFSSRIWITYRKGFESLGESKLTSDVGWGCMLRSGQILLAQALVCHYLGRTWRRNACQECLQEYLQILQSFGDSESCSFSIHNLLEAGRPFGLAAGSWLGPYALCRTLEALAKADEDQNAKKGGKRALPFAVYVVSGETEGDRGGAPVRCVEDAAVLCSKWGEATEEWSPLVVLVPLVLGLDKLNPRYLPSLRATFTLPQSLGVAGGKPGASTHLIGVQGDQAMYLDPHENQQVFAVTPENLELDTSFYHCSVVRRLPLDSIDPSLAIGFYCRDRAEFDDLCARSSELVKQYNGAPIFTVAEKSAPSKLQNSSDMGLEESFSKDPSSEDDWQML